MKKAKRDYNSIFEIRMAKERYRYDTIVHREKLYNRTGLIFSNMSLSLRDWSMDVRSKLFKYSFFRKIYKTSIFFGVARSFAGLFRQPR
jgi:hypothetical protein